MHVFFFLHVAPGARSMDGVRWSRRGDVSLCGGRRLLERAAGHPIGFELERIAGLTEPRPR
jgi:hypothetical protein